MDKFAILASAALVIAVVVTVALIAFPETPEVEFSLQTSGQYLVASWASVPANAVSVVLFTQQQEGVTPFKGKSAASVSDGSVAIATSDGVTSFLAGASYSVVADFFDANGVFVVRAEGATTFGAVPTVVAVSAGPPWVTTLTYENAPPTAVSASVVVTDLVMEVAYAAATTSVSSPTLTQLGTTGAYFAAGTLYEFAVTFLDANGAKVGGASTTLVYTSANGGV